MRFGESHPFPERITYQSEHVGTNKVKMAMVWKRFFSTPFNIDINCLKKLIVANLDQKFPTLLK